MRSISETETDNILTKQMAEIDRISSEHIPVSHRMNAKIS